MTIILADCIDSAVLVLMAVVALALATGRIPVPWREPLHRRVLVIGAVTLLLIALVMPVVNAVVREHAASPHAEAPAPPAPLPAAHP